MIHRARTRWLDAWREVRNEAAAAIAHMVRMLDGTYSRTTGPPPRWRPLLRPPGRTMGSLLIVLATCELVMGGALLAARLWGGEVVIAVALGSMGGVLLSEIFGGRR